MKTLIRKSDGHFMIYLRTNLFPVNIPQLLPDEVTIDALKKRIDPEWSKDTIEWDQYEIVDMVSGLLPDIIRCITKALVNSDSKIEIDLLREALQVSVLLIRNSEFKETVIEMADGFDGRNFETMLLDIIGKIQQFMNKDEIKNSKNQ